MLGRLLLHKEPAIARSLLQEFNEAQKPSLTTLSQIPTLYSRNSISDKRLFIAYVLLLYAPATLDHECYPLPRGFNQTLAVTLGQQKQNVPRLIKDAITYYKVYPDFRQQADALAKKEVA